MHLGAGRTADGRVFAFGTLRWMRQPILHLHAILGAFEYDKAAHDSVCQYTPVPKLRIFT
jgi:hypothetical protein